MLFGGNDRKRRRKRPKRAGGSRRQTAIQMPLQEQKNQSPGTFWSHLARELPVPIKTPRVDSTQAQRASLPRKGTCLPGHGWMTSKKRTRQSGCLPARRPPCGSRIQRHQCGKPAFVRLTPTVWNLTLNSLPDSPTLSLFKFGLKTVIKKPLYLEQVPMQLAKPALCSVSAPSLNFEVGERSGEMEAVGNHWSSFPIYDL